MGLTRQKGYGVHSHFRQRTQCCIAAVIQSVQWVLYQCNSSWNNYLYTDSRSDSHSSQSVLPWNLVCSCSLLPLFCTQIWCSLVIPVILCARISILQTYSSPLLLKLWFSFSVFVVPIMLFLPRLLFFTFAYDIPPVISHRLKHLAWIPIKIVHEHVPWWESWLLVPCPLLNRTGFFLGSQREVLVNRNIRHKLVGLNWYTTVAESTFKAEIIVMWTCCTFLLHFTTLTAACSEE